MVISPLVSIIIPAYNYGHLIERSIESVLNQTFTDYELIIINDASTDNTNEVIQQYTDKRIKLINNSHNLGASESWNIASEKAIGTYICILCADDSLPERSLELRVNEIITKNVDVIHTGLNKISETDDIIEYIRPIDTESDSKLLNFLMYDEVGFGINIATFMYKKSIINQIGKRDSKPAIRAHQDYEYALRILTNFPSTFIDENSYNYHVHKNGELDKYGNDTIAVEYLKSFKDKYIEFLRKRVENQGLA